MLTNQRHELILHMLHEAGFCQLQDLVHRTNTSESTIRRDLNELEQQGLLERIHGGAQLKQRAVGDERMAEREQSHPAEKRHLAEYIAAAYLRDYQAIFLDAGTTVAMLIPHLKERAGLTVYTNSVQTASMLADADIPNIIPGGQVKPQTKAIVGAIAARFLGSVHVDLAFIGTNGISARAGLMTPDPEEAAIKQVMISAARRSIVLADHSKFDQQALVTFAQPDDVDEIVTDFIPSPLQNDFRRFTTIKELTSN
ncbi:MAG: DeoR/GlpR family DNA-binding transcription regulator [Schleiferilactobacillus perolens]|uniref:DeoR/GlpR family DNA-binding transcription regulator n=1 Tax=Schleiferilactobacillus perolens TaxID=100468 RepID=UPI0039E84AA3|nr:DeoR/GlpR family DNA-binding transcription regulator [Schleiferilactobacillus harbinensis]MCI1912522.1 DeoR/GlpR family DNA-binding transcription regulator [Schleiferilactobacillus harbinensis]